MKKNNTIVWLKNISVFFSVFFLCVFCFKSFIQTQQDVFVEWEENILFVLDVSTSMNVLDASWWSRLAVAKEYIADVLYAWEGFSYAVNIFAWEPQRIMPFTQNKELVLTFLSWLDNRNVIQQGSNIESALEQAVSSFSVEQSWTIILITDGDESQWINTKIIQEKLNEKRIELYIVWVWSMQWWFIPTGNIFEPYKMYQGREVLAQLQEGSLIDLSGKLWWEYIYIDNKLPEELLSWWSDEEYSYFLFIILSFFFWIVFIALHVVSVYKINFQKYV